MFQSSKFIQSLTAGIALILGAAVTTPAMGAAVFSSTAIGDLILVDILPAGSLDGLTINGSGNIDFDLITGDPEVDADIAFFDDPLGFGVGFDTLMEAFADGVATSEGNATAFALVDISNGSTGTVELIYGFDWELEVLAERDSSIGAAFAEASVDLLVNGLVTDGPDSISAAISAGALTNTMDNAFDSLLFTLSVPSGESASIEVELNAFGSAAVPAPPVITLMILGLGVLGLRLRASAFTGWHDGHHTSSAPSARKSHRGG